MGRIHIRIALFWDTQRRLMSLPSHHNHTYPSQSRPSSAMPMIFKRSLDRLYIPCDLMPRCPATTHALCRCGRKVAPSLQAAGIRLTRHDIKPERTTAAAIGDNIPQIQQGLHRWG